MAKDSGAPVDPDDIIRQSFTTVRRGADPLEVQRYLLDLANQMRAARQREQDLVAQLAEAEKRATPIDQLDPSRLTALLGEETARVLDAARAAAAEIRAKAEENVARQLREARDEAQHMRNDAETVLLRRTEEAEAEVARIRATADGLREQAELDAEGIRSEAATVREAVLADAETIAREADAVRAQGEVDAAARVEEGRQEGREMVAEAQRVRQRMLEDLARRRKLLRQQIEQLQAGRDRLLAAYEVVRETLDVATEELQVALPEAKLAAEAAALRAGEDDEAVFAAEVEAAALATAPEGSDAGAETAAESADDTGTDEGAGKDEVTVDAEAPDGVVVAVVEEIEVVETVEVVDGEVSRATAEVDMVGSLVELDRDEDADAADGAVELAPDPVEGRRSSSVKVVRSPSAERTAAIFARLRDDEPTSGAPTSEGPSDGSSIEAATAEAATAEGETGTETETETGGERDELASVLAELETTLARSIKRDLSDEQNELLDAMRRQKGTPSASGVLPAIRDQRQRYRALALPVLADSVEAATEAAADGGAGGELPSVEDLADELADGLVLPLRERLEQCFDEAGTDREDLADRIRAVYREWKAQQVDLPVAQAVMAAASRGSAAPSG